MNSKQRVGKYSAPEEKINVVSHAIGILAGIVALVLLLARTLPGGETIRIISALIFGFSLILLYTASTLYHGSKDSKHRNRLQVFDHASIYILIAGSYTPFMLITLEGRIGRILLVVIWGLAICGVVIKLFFTGRFNLVLTIMYILLGWIVVLVLKPLIANLAINGVILLFAGGISYTLGAVIYGIKKIPGNHAIFHLFVLIGSLCHFLSIYFYVLPVQL